MTYQDYFVCRNGEAFDRLDVEILLDSAHLKCVNGAGTSIVKFNGDWAAAVNDLVSGFNAQDGERVRSHALAYAEYKKHSRGHGFVLPIPHEDALFLYLSAESLWSSMINISTSALVEDMATLNRGIIANKLEMLRRALAKVSQ